MHKALPHGAALAMLLTGVCHVSANSYIFSEISYPTANETVVNGINDTGKIVGTYGSSIDIRNVINLGSRGFVYDGLAWTSVQAFGSNATSVAAVNNSDDFVGYYRTPAGTASGFISEGGILTDILPDFANEAIVSDIDDNDVIVGIWSSTGAITGGGSDISGFRGVKGGDGNYVFTPVDFPGALRTFLNGRNNAGNEVGSYFDGASVNGFLLPDFVSSFVPDSTFTSFSDVSNSGLIAVNAQYIDFFDLSGMEKAFFVTVSDLQQPAPTYEEIVLPGSGCSFSLDGELKRGPTCARSLQQVNTAGTIAGFYDNNNGIFRGFIGTSIALPGDYNADGKVDAADYVVWRKNAGKSTYLPNDSTPGDVSPADYNIWRSEFGSMSAANIALPAIPEPTCIALTASLAVLILSAPCARASRISAA